VLWPGSPGHTAQPPVQQAEYALLLLMIAAIVGASVLFRTPVVIALVRPLMERIW